MQGQLLFGGEVLGFAEAMEQLELEKMSFDPNQWKLILRKPGGETRLVPSTEFRFVNDARGELRHVVVKMHTPNGEYVWVQWEFMDAPGSVIVPFQNLARGKGQTENEVYVYLLLVNRLIPENRLNLPSPLSAGDRQRGILSIEFPRGVGSDVSNTMRLSDQHSFDQVALLGNQGMFDASSATGEMDEEIPFLKMQGEPILGFGYNPNTSHFVSTQAGWLAPIGPDNERAMEEITTSQKVEGIRSLIRVRFPEDTDQIVLTSQRYMNTGFWGSQTPILIDGFTLSSLAVLGTMVRRGKLPVTK